MGGTALSQPAAARAKKDAAGEAVPTEPVLRRGTTLRAADQYSADTLFQLVPQYPRDGATGMACSSTLP